MGIILLGSENLASDYSNQNPSVFGRSKDTETISVAPYIEKVVLAGGNINIIFHNYSVWPADEWTSYRNGMTAAELEKVVKIDMSKSWFDDIFYQSGTRKFDGMPNLATVLLPEKLIGIGLNTFTNHPKLSFINLPDTIERIENNVFNGCTALQLNKLPKNLKTIGSSAFQGTKLNITELPNGVQSVDTNAFAQCNEITRLRIPASTSMANWRSFAFMTGLEYLELGGQLTDQAAFKGCSSLKKVWVRSSCETISAGSATSAPFIDCPDDLQIYVEPDSKPAGWGSYFNRTGASGATTVTVTYSQTTSPF